MASIAEASGIRRAMSRARRLGDRVRGLRERLLDTDEPTLGEAQEVGEHREAVIEAVFGPRGSRYVGRDQREARAERTEPFRRTR